MYRKGKLTDDRIKKLEKIGFVWNPSKKRAITANGPPRNYEGLDQLASLASEAELLEVEVEKEDSESNESSDNSHDEEEKDVGDSTSSAKPPTSEGVGATPAGDVPAAVSAPLQPATTTTTDNQELPKVEAELEDEKMSADEESKIRILGEWGSRIVEDKAADSDTESDDGKKRKRRAWY